MAIIESSGSPEIDSYTTVAGIQPNYPEAHSNIEGVRTAPQLRTYTERVQRLYDVVHDRMTRSQVTWGRNLDIFDDPEVAEFSLVRRRAKALQKALLEMPIVIEDDDLIVGNTVQDGAITGTRLPKYGTDKEYAQAKTEGSSLSTGLSHKTPYFYGILGKGLSGIISDIENKISEISMRQASDERDEKLELY